MNKAFCAEHGEEVLRLVWAASCEERAAIPVKALAEPFWIYVRIKDVYERVDLLPRAIKQTRRVCGICDSDASVQIEVGDIWPAVAVVAIEQAFSRYLHAATDCCFREDDQG